MANDRLRDALLRNGLTPELVAERVGVDPKTAERWITKGRPPYPKFRHAVAAMVQESESYLWPGAVPAERATRVSQSELVQIYPRRSAVPVELWQRLVDQAVEHVGILVYSGLFLPELQPRLIPALTAKAAAGAKVAILLGDPDCDEVARRGAEEGIGEAMASKIRNVLSFYAALREVPGVKVKLHRTTLYNSIYRFDNEMLVNTHLLGFPAAHAPVMHLRRLSGGDLFDSYADSFDRVLAGALPAWPATVAA
jgi:hypothetical protein